MFVTLCKDERFSFDARFTYSTKAEIRIINKFGCRRKMLRTFIFAKQLISRKGKSGDDISGDLVR